MGFPHSSVDKESTCNAGDPGSIPGLGRSTGEGIDYPFFLGFPCGSAGKESACNARDPGSIPGLGRSAREGIGYPLQYSWASLVAQLVKNPPAMRETWVRTLGWEDPLAKGTGYPLQYSGLENSMDYIVNGVTKSQTRLSDFQAKQRCGSSTVL